MSVQELIRNGQPIDKVAAAFNGLSHEDRVQEMYSLTKSDQAKLFELAAGRTCHLAGDFVPSKTSPLTEVIHFGFNSLPLHRKFQKRFAWQTTGRDGLVGYNEQTLKTITGPGYFVAREAPLDKVPTVVIDYTLPAKEKAAAWPTILPNSARLSRFIYNGMQDWMWKVSDHVSIGRANKGGQWQDNWFVLCRDGRA